MKTILALLLSCFAARAQMRGPAWLVAQTASAPAGETSCSFWTNNPAVTSGVDGYFCSGINSVAITNLTGAAVTLCGVTMAIAGEGTSHLEVWTSKNATGTQKGGDSSSYVRTGAGWTTNAVFTFSTRPTWDNNEVLYLTRIVDSGQAWVGMTVSVGVWASTSFCGASETAEGAASWMIWEMTKE